MKRLENLEFVNEESILVKSILALEDDINKDKHESVALRVLKNHEIT